MSHADRLKDLTSISGVRDNPLVGYGIVVGLAGSGDGNSGLLLQSMQAMVSQFGLVTNASGLSGKNSCCMVTAELPALPSPDKPSILPSLHSEQQNHYGVALF